MDQFLPSRIVQRKKREFLLHCCWNPSTHAISQMMRSPVWWMNFTGDLAFGWDGAISHPVGAISHPVVCLHLQEIISQANSMHTHGTHFLLSIQKTTFTSNWGPPSQFELTSKCAHRRLNSGFLSHDTGNDFQGEWTGFSLSPISMWVCLRPQSSCHSELA